MVRAFRPEGRRGSGLSLLLLSCLVATTAASIIGAFVWLHEQNLRHQQERENWPEVLGKVTGARVVREAPARNFPVTMYVGQCSVNYSVNDEVYTIWVASGYMGPDPRVVSEMMTECPVPSYVVHYNPDKPFDAYVKGH